MNVPTSLSPSEILDLPMSVNDARAKTIRDYLIKLVAALWEQGESFSGKRPFGNSGWEFDVLQSLVSAKVLAGDADGYPKNERMARKIIAKAIKAL